MEIKKFDCVKMKNEAAEKIYHIIKSMNIEDELLFWNSEQDYKDYCDVVEIKKNNKKWIKHEDLKKELGL